MMFEKIKETLCNFLNAEQRIISDAKTKSLTRKKVKILDEWNMWWEMLFRTAGTNYEKAFYKSYYGMLTTSILSLFDDIEDLDGFIRDIINREMKGCDTNG